MDSEGRRLSTHPLLKRGLDFGGAVCLLLLAFPLMVVVAVAVYCSLGTPIFYRQQRVGRGGQCFGLLKFRTMENLMDGGGRLLSDEKRLTRLGRFLRSSSLDELPQLLNVIKGDMSLVGPRPLLVEYLERYTREQARRHEVRPGITGWAQVNGRNELTWEEKFRLDVWYVDHRSLMLDLGILWKTARLVAKREGISARGCVTMPPFLGSQGTR